MPSLRKGIEKANSMFDLSLSVDWRVNPQTEIADGWTELQSAAGVNYNVYYREVTTNQMGASNASAILKDNKVTVNDTVTKEMMTAADFTQPTLTFTAYASQLYRNQTDKFEAADAWSNLHK